MKSNSPPPLAADSPRTYAQILTEPRFQAALLAFLAVILYFSKLGVTGLATWDDCYYAQKAKEILQTGDWLTMHYNGQATFDNPPFYMWMTVLSYKLFGVSEFAAKFPSALMGVLAVVLTFWFVSYLYDHWVGLYSAFVLATTTMFAKYARHAMFDVTLTFFVVLALFSLVLAIDGRRGFLFLWGVCIGICILIKSVLGLFPLFISVVVLVLTGNFRLLFSWQFVLSGLTIVALGGSWYFHQFSIHGQRFVDVHFKWLLLERGFGKEPLPWHRHLSYLKDFLVYYWPWLPLSAYGLGLLARRAWRGGSTAILTIVWFVSYVGIMSVMQSKKFWYIMPVLPATAIAAAVAFNSLVSERKRLVVAKVVFVASIITFLVATMSPLKFDRERQKDIRLIAPYVKYFCTRDAKVIAYRYTFWYLNNPLLFYSDCAASPVFSDVSEVHIAFADRGIVLCLTDTAGMEEMKQELESVHVIKVGESMALLSNRRLDTSAVR